MWKAPNPGGRVAQDRGHLTCFEHIPLRSLCLLGAWRVRHISCSHDGGRAEPSF